MPLSIDCVVKRLQLHSLFFHVGKKYDCSELVYDAARVCRFFGSTRHIINVGLMIHLGVNKSVIYLPILQNG